VRGREDEESGDCERERERFWELGERVDESVSGVFDEEQRIFLLGEGRGDEAGTDGGGVARRV